MPQPLAWLTDDHHAVATSGFIPSGWVPPPSVPAHVAAMLPGALADFEAALVPADHAVTVTLLSRLSMSMRLEDMPESAWAVHIEDFAADLGTYPPDIVAEGCALWRRSNKFWPTISEFLDLVRPLLRERQAAHRRLQVLARVAADPCPERVVTDEWHRRITRTGGAGDERRGGGPKPIGELARVFAAGGGR